MLHNVKSIFRYKSARASPTAATTIRPDPHNLRKFNSNESLTGKVVTAGKHVYTVCKSKISTTSQSSSPAHSAKSNSSITLSDQTTATGTALPPVDLGDAFLVPGCSTMNDTTSAVAVPPASLEASARVKTTASMTRTAATTPESEPYKKSVSELDESSVNTKSKSKLRSLCKRFKEKCQKFMASKHHKIAKEEEVATEVDKEMVKSHLSSDNVQGSNPPNAAAGHELTAPSDVIRKNTAAGDVGHDKEDDDDTDDEGDKGQTGPFHPRFDWKTIHAITNDQIEHVVQKHLGPVIPEKHTVWSRTFGTYNLVAFIAPCSKPFPTLTYVMRIPAHGTPSHWTPEDAYMLEREVQLVEYIRQNTMASVPQILAYSSNCDNELGSPYILMTKLDGKSAYDIWFDHPYNSSDAFRNADVPSIATEKKRVNFLRSLARTMTEIQNLSFDKIGMPEISEDGQTITVGPSYSWGEDEEDVDKATTRPAYPTTRMYVNTSLAKNFKVNPRAEKNAMFYSQFGVRKILNIIFSQPIFNASLSGPETFTIHHNDLDLQNILVDDDGNVTGIIDWDKSYAAPRCIGASSVPIFLRSDWFPRYTHDLRITPHMGWNEHYYRQIYAAAMVEVGNPDAKYTLKSAIYQACISAIYEGGDYNDLIEKLVRYLPECRIHTEDLKLGLGMGWPAAIEMLECQLKKIFEPELPRAGLLKDLNEELELKGWLGGFDNLLASYEEEEDDEGANHDSSDFEKDEEL